MARGSARDTAPVAYIFWIGAGGDAVHAIPEIRLRSLLDEHTVCAACSRDRRYAGADAHIIRRAEAEADYAAGRAVVCDDCGKTIR
jgi:hypothetical protein